MKNSRARSGGFMTIMAVVLVVMASITVAAVATMFTADARRTRSAEPEAQLRQLLLAGGAAARQSPPAEGQHRTLPVPASLPDATLTLTGVGDHIVVRATLGKYSQEEDLALVKTDARYQIADATLR